MTTWPQQPWLLSLSHLAFVVLLSGGLGSAIWQQLYTDQAFADGELPVGFVGISLGDCQSQIARQCCGCSGYWAEYSESLKWCYCSPDPEHVLPIFDHDNGKRYGKNIWYSGDCEDLKDAVGQWVELQSNPGPSRLTISTGVTRSFTATNTETWGEKATASVNVGFKALGFGQSATVTGEVSHSLSQEYANSFSASSTTTQEFDFPAGLVWQWQFIIPSGICGNTTVSHTDFAVTEGLFAPPCCLPGYAQNISHYHGPCHAASDGTVYNLCGNSSSSTLPVTVKAPEREGASIQI